jgi:hypothetical protein
LPRELGDIDYTLTKPGEGFAYCRAAIGFQPSAIGALGLLSAIGAQPRSVLGFRAFWLKADSRQPIAPGVTEGRARLNAY